MTTYPDEIYSVRAAAHILGLSENRVRVLLVSRGLGQQGRIPDDLWARKEVPL